mmetsp:Transcript_3467/g.7151  ORF Transcript_3467/g.7151 Transcript_3467/m.7151 type:complete len:89 (+) Transcript_3467:3-269(+)
MVQMIPMLNPSHAIDSLVRMVQMIPAEFLPVPNPWNAVDFPWFECFKGMGESDCACDGHELVTAHTVGFHFVVWLLFCNKMRFKLVFV